MKILATIGLGFLVAIASAVCLLSSICTFAGGLSGSDRRGFALCGLMSLAIAVGGVVLIGKINRKQP